MSGITSPSSANRGVAAVAAAIGSSSSAGNAAVNGSITVPGAGELPYTGAPLAIIMGGATLLIGAGLAMRVVAYVATRRELAREHHATPG